MPKNLCSHHAYPVRVQKNSLVEQIYNIERRMFMDKQTANDDVSYTLDDDWKSLTIHELETAAFKVVQENSKLVEKKLDAIVGKDVSLGIIGMIWECMNIQPMDLVKHAQPEIIAAALADCSAKEAAIVMRFIGNETREKVITLLSGENGQDWRDAERHIEKNIAEKFG
jgi:hypothetical protein